MVGTAMRSKGHGFTTVFPGLLGLMHRRLERWRATNYFRFFFSVVINLLALSVSASSPPLFSLPLYPLSLSVSVSVSLSLSCVLIFIYEYSLLWRSEDNLGMDPHISPWLRQEFFVVGRVYT